MSTVTHLILMDGPSGSLLLENADRWRPLIGSPGTSLPTGGFFLSSGVIDCVRLSEQQVNAAFQGAISETLGPSLAALFKGTLDTAHDHRVRMLPTSWTTWRKDTTGKSLSRCAPLMGLEAILLLTPPGPKMNFVFLRSLIGLNMAGYPVSFSVQTNVLTSHQDTPDKMSSDDILFPTFADFNEGGQRLEDMRAIQNDLVIVG